MEYIQSSYDVQAVFFCVYLFDCQTTHHQQQSTLRQVEV